MEHSVDSSPLPRGHNFEAKLHSSFGSLLVRPGKVSWITLSCSSLATTIAVSLEEFQSFQSFHFLFQWCQRSVLHWIAAAMAPACFPLCPTYV